MPKTAVSAGRRTKKPNPAALTVTELARQTGVSVRNIRAYQTAGLLAPPTLKGRTALYSGRHASRLNLIRELRQVGFKLETIKEMLERVPSGVDTQYALVAQMFSNGFFQVEHPQRMSLKALAAHWGEHASEADIKRLLDSGLYRAVPSANAADEAGEAMFEALSPSLWRIGKELAELGMPLSVALDMQDNLIQHTRAIAMGFVDQFVMAMVKEMSQSSALQQANTSGEPEHLTLPPNLLRTVHAVIDRLRPLAIGSVSAAFPVVLQQEFDRDVLERIQKRLDKSTSGPRP
jgi:DNA-binding transcriptional MerR regulator